MNILFFTLILKVLNLFIHIVNIGFHNGMFILFFPELC